MTLWKDSPVLVCATKPSETQEGDGTESPSYVEVRHSASASGHLLPPTSCVLTGWLPTSAARPGPRRKTSRPPQPSQNRRTHDLGDQSPASRSPPAILTAQKAELGWHLQCLLPLGGLGATGVDPAVLLARSLRTFPWNSLWRRGSQARPQPGLRPSSSLNSLSAAGY